MTRSCRTYGFQDQPGYWYPSNSEMRANKIKQVPGDLKLRTDKDKTRKQGTPTDHNKINHFSCSILNHEKLEKEYVCVRDKFNSVCK